MAIEIELTGDGLAVEDVESVAFGRATVRLGDRAIGRIEASRALIEQAVESGTPTYGVNTGFGRFADVAIAHDEVARLQLNLLRSHACGVGEPFPTEVVRAAILLRANALATRRLGRAAGDGRAAAGAARPRASTRVVPSRGSLGASGDLAPLAHLALPLVGEGEAERRRRAAAGRRGARAARGSSRWCWGPRRGWR